MDTDTNTATATVLDNPPSANSTGSAPGTAGSNAQSTTYSDDSLNVSFKPASNSTTQRNKAQDAPQATGSDKSVHKGTKMEVKWHLTRLKDPALMDDEGRLSNGWRYSFDFNNPTGTVTLSNGSFELTYNNISNTDTNNNLEKIKSLIFDMHYEPDPEQYCKQLMKLLKKDTGRNPEVEEDPRPDVMESLASKLTPMLNRINASATAPNEEGQDFLQVDNGFRDIHEANAKAYESLSSNVTLKQMRKNPNLFYEEKFKSRDSHSRSVTIKKHHGDGQKRKKEDRLRKGNWDSVTLEQRDGALYATVNAQKHIGFKSNFIERRTYGIQRWIEDKIVNRIERLTKGLAGIYKLIPKFIRKKALKEIHRFRPEYDPDSAVEKFSKAAPYLACAAIATLAVATLPVTAPFVGSVVSAVAPYLSSAVGFVSPYVASAGTWFSTTFPAVSGALSQVGSAFSFATPYVSSIASWLSTTFPGAASVASQGSGLILQGLSSLAANGAIAGCIATPFFLTTRLGAKMIGGLGKFTTKFQKTEPTTISFKIAELDPDEEAGDLNLGDGDKIIEKVEKILDLFSKDKVTASSSRKEQLEQLFYGSYVKTNKDTISRSNFIEQLLADDTINLAEMNNAELNGLRWFGMGEHPGAKWNSCRSIDSNLYIFESDLIDCELYNSKIYTGSENGDGRINIDGGYYDDTVAFFGNGCSLFCNPIDFFSAMNPFDRTLRFKADLTQVEGLARMDYGISPPQWYHPLQSYTFNKVYGGMHVSNAVLEANPLYKKFFTDKESPEARDRRLTRLYMYVQAEEYIKNLTNPNFFPNVNVNGRHRFTDVDGNTYEIDTNGYFIKVSSDAQKSSTVNSDYASPEMKKLILNKQLLEKNGRKRKEAILKVTS